MTQETIDKIEKLEKAINSPATPENIKQTMRKALETLKSENVEVVIETPTDKKYSSIKSCLLDDGDDSDDYIYEGKLIHNVEVLPKDTWEIVEFYKYGAVLKHVPTSVLADSKPNKNVSLEELKSLFASDKIEIDGIEKGNTKLFNICIKAIIKCIDSIDMAAYKENLLAELNASKSELEKTIEASNLLESEKSAILAEKSNLEKETSEKIQSLESDIAAKSISMEEATRLKEEETAKLKKQLEDLEALNAMRTLIDMLSDDIAKKDKPTDLPENKSGKIKVKEIRLFAAEGKVSGYGFPKVVKTYEEANDAVMPVYQDAIESSYANKCGFTVTFEDGSEYSADLLVSEKHDNPTKGNVIGKHIKDYLENDLKNDYVSDETKKQARYFLENYDLGFDEKNILIKDWYTKKYPSDDLGQRINKDKTFNDIWNDIPNVYSILGVGDSLIRERVFEKLAEINGVEYGYVYNKWLNNDEYAKGGEILNENAQMVINQNHQIKHHTEELGSIVDDKTHVPAWVVSKVSDAANDLSDVTHYLDGENNKMEKGGELNSILKEFNELTAVNNHDDAAILLAEHYGTDEEVSKLKSIQRNHDRTGHTTKEDQDVRDSISNKYYYQLKDLVKIDGVSLNRLKSEFSKEPEIFTGSVVKRGGNEFKIDGDFFYMKTPDTDWVKFRKINFNIK